MITKQDLRQENGLEDFFSQHIVSARIAAAKGKDRLAQYRPDPTTGKQAPGTMIRFGLAVLDERISMMKGCYYLVAARARVGKTAMGMQIADNAMRQLQGTGKQVAIFSAEMDAASLTLREACAIERINYWDMAKGLLSQEQYDALALRLDEIAESGYWLDETPAPTIEHMIVQLEALAAGDKGVGMVLFDYLELAGDSERDEVKRIAKISRGLKAIAKRFDCPVLALGQLNRDIDRRAEKKPSLADLMYGGEREPDGIIILHRPDLYDDSTPKIKDRSGKERLMVEAHIVKHRHGPGGDVVLAFDPDTMRFDSAVRNRVPLNEED